MLKLPFNLNPQSPSNKFLTIDIDSDSVKCLAFYVQETPGTKPIAKIVGVGKQHIENGAVRAGVIIDVDRVEDALRLALDQALNTTEEDVTDVIFGVGGNLSLGFITTAKIVRAKNEPIQKKELDDLYKKIRESAFAEAQSEMLQINGDSDTDLEIVTSSTVYIKIDGSPVKDPVGQQGATLEIAFFTAFTPKYQVKAFQQLAKRLGLNILAIGSEKYCLVKALNGSDCVIIAVTNDYTGVGVVFGGGIVSTRNLDIGSIQFTNEISQNFGVSFREAEKMKRTYAYGKLSPSESTLVQNCLREALRIWLEGLKLLFAEFTGVKTFAPQIFLVEDAAELPDIYDLLTKEPWAKSIPFKSPPSISKVSLQSLPSIYDSTGSLGSLEYVLNASLSTIYLEMKGYVHD